MSFDPLRFIYNPPLTVDIPTTATVSTTTGVAPQSAAISTGSNAAALMSRLDDMVAASNYLQSAILSIVGNNKTTINFNADPDTARAFTNLYGSLPDYITPQVYANILDAQTSIMAIDIALSSNSTVQVNPYQQSNLMTISGAYEDAASQTNTYLSRLPLLLRTLKGESLIYQSLHQSLSTYPVISHIGPLAPPITNINAATTTALTVDTSTSLNDYLNSNLDTMSVAYAGIYSLVGGLSPVESDISNVISIFSTQPPAEIIQTSGMLQALKALVHLPQLDSLADDLLNFSWTQLLCEAGSFIISLDKFAQHVLQPYTNAIGSMASIVTALSGVSQQAGYVNINGMQGMIQGNPSSPSPTQSTQNAVNQQTGANLINQIKIPKVGLLTEGVISTAAHMEWAQRQSTINTDQLTLNYKRLNSRKTNNWSDTQQLMSSLKDIDSLITVTSSLTNSTQVGSSSTQSNVTNDILTNLNNESGAVFTMNNGKIVATPPSIPALPSNVEKVLTTGGIKFLSIK